MPIRARRSINRAKQVKIANAEADRQALVVETLTPDELVELRAWLAARGRQIESVERPRAQIDRLLRECLGRTAAEP